MTKKQGLEPTASGLRKWLIGGVVAAVATVSAVVGFAGPAAADPVTTYVATGSDTIQDVSNAFASGVGLGVLGSWDAVDPTGQASCPKGTPVGATCTAQNPQISPKAGCIMGRPNGSGAGVAALRFSINPATTATPILPDPSPGCVDIARSSSGPGGNASTSGLLQYVPFALDAVTTATGPATAVTGTDPAVATAIKDADLITFQNLKDLYTCNAPVTVNGTSYDPRTGAVDNPTATPPVIAVHLKLPQLNSGTRNFWATQMGINATTPPTCVQDTYQDNAVPPVTHSVEEHDGSVFAADAHALGPFSVAQFIAQSNGKNPRLHNAAIHNITPLPTQTGKQANPTTGSLATGDLALNPNFSITREVYNVVELARITSGNPKFDAGLSALLVGGASRLCGSSFLITSFGFATLTGAPLGHTCGAVTSDLQAFATV